MFSYNQKYGKIDYEDLILFLGATSTTLLCTDGDKVHFEYIFLY